MKDMPICKYKNVSERDMDLLFIEAFATDPNFAALFIRKTSLQDAEFKVLHAERSKVDNGLGESDITVIIEAQGKKHALMIENKIDAIAMPDQHGRYLKRGEKGISLEEYDCFYVFIVCPEKYRYSNEEAAKYEHFVSYEECRDYFLTCSDAHSMLYHQQICQALETMKAEYKVDLNEIAVESFQKYAEYQKTFYGRINLKSKANSQRINGWWPEFNTSVDGMSIIHKTNFGCVDLTISGAADQLSELKLVEKWMQEYGYKKISVVKTGKSASFRIEVPEIKMGKPFETWKLGDLDACFEAVQELTDLATMFGVISNIVKK